jgi:hypothetical protein
MPSFFPLRRDLGNILFLARVGTITLQISVTYVPGVTGPYHRAQLLVEMGSHKHFAIADLELWCSWSQPLK